MSLRCVLCIRRGRMCENPDSVIVLNFVQFWSSTEIQCSTVYGISEIPDMLLVIG